MSAVDTSLPPALFDVEQTRREVILEPPGTGFIPWGERLCGICRKPMKRLSWSYGCGSSSGDGSYVICDDCAPDDLLRGTNRSRWGITRGNLAADRIRRKVYAAGGGETEVRRALIEAGLITPCPVAWTRHHDGVDHDEHACLFITTGPHTRHECRCGLEKHETDTSGDDLA